MNNFTRAHLATELGIDRERVRRWTRHYGLPCTRQNPRRAVINSRDFIRWAIAHPQQLAGIESDRLSRFLDPKFCASVANLHYVGRSKPVKNLDTGAVYESIRAAAADCYVAESCIPHAIARNGFCVGARWVFVEEAA